MKNSILLEKALHDLGDLLWANSEVPQREATGQQIKAVANDLKTLALKFRNSQIFLTDSTKELLEKISESLSSETAAVNSVTAQMKNAGEKVATLLDLFVTQTDLEQYDLRREETISQKQAQIQHFETLIKESPSSPKAAANYNNLRVLRLQLEELQGIAKRAPAAPVIIPKKEPLNPLKGVVAADDLDSADKENEPQATEKNIEPAPIIEILSDSEAERLALITAAQATELWVAIKSAIALSPKSKKAAYKNEQLAKFGQPENYAAIFFLDNELRITNDVINGVRNLPEHAAFCLNVIWDKAAEQIEQHKSF